MDSEKYYRVVTRETFERIPFDGLLGQPATQRMSIDGNQFIVERAPEFSKNVRWFNHAEALALVAGPEWNDLNPFPQIFETDGET